jgi:predicted nucleic acid-binding protein
VIATVVDTSAWVDFLRGNRAAGERVGRLLSAGAVVVSGPIQAEVLSGAKTSAEYERLRRLFEALIRVTDPPGVWDRVGEYRFALARSGFQAEIVDLAVAVTALSAGYRLLTRDRDFARIRTVVPIELDLF